MSTGFVFTVRRPEDGEIVTLTCTQKQLEEVWLPAGYILVEEQTSVPKAAKKTIGKKVEDAQSIGAGTSES
jgi:CRISPR/Cas system-associated protein endoribonuclease Cas2